MNVDVIFLESVGALAKLIVQMVRIYEKNEIEKHILESYEYISIFLLKFWRFFLKLTKPCRQAEIVHRCILNFVWYILGKAFQTLPPVATTVHSGTNTIIGYLVYRGLPSDLRSRPEQSQNVPETTDSQ